MLCPGLKGKWYAQVRLRNCSNCMPSQNNKNIMSRTSKEIIFPEAVEEIQKSYHRGSGKTIVSKTNMENNMHRGI